MARQASRPALTTMRIHPTYNAQTITAAKSQLELKQASKLASIGVMLSDQRAPCCRLSCSFLFSLLLFELLSLLLPPLCRSLFALPGTTSLVTLLTAQRSNTF